MPSGTRRRGYRLPWWHWVQTGFGLAIKYLLLVHVVNIRGIRVPTGIDIDYPHEIANLRVDPWTRARQVLLVRLAASSPSECSGTSAF